jgi:hypothetical protein
LLKKLEKLFFSDFLNLFYFFLYFLIILKFSYYVGILEFFKFFLIFLNILSFKINYRIMHKDYLDITDAYYYLIIVAYF